MQIGTPEDGASSVMIDMDSALYIVKERAIYAIQMADQVDPERTNAAVPNTQQRLLSIGTHDPEVARIFLTAYTMFKSKHLGTSFPEREAWSHAFEYLRDIVAMTEIRAALVKAIEEAVAGSNKVVTKDRSITLPALGNAKERCDAFAQKIGHAIDTLKAVAHLFYPKELSKKWIDSLTVVAAQKHGDDDPLALFMKEKREYLLFMRDLRNMIEHPKVNTYVKVSDFQLLPSMDLVAPSLDIVRPGKTPIAEPLASFMAQVIEELVSIAEVFFALLCGANAESFSAFPLTVVELPLSRRPTWNPHQRISYGIVVNGEVHPLG
ncbi:hypothetical protein H6G65_16660 [Microcystis elabens FACHB-917]|nr:hypothetical protein [Microcystis elabens FACHB-917]